MSWLELWRWLLHGVNAVVAKPGLGRVLKVIDETLGVIDDWWKRIKGVADRALGSVTAEGAPPEVDPQVPIVCCPTCAGQGLERREALTGYHPGEECSFCRGNRFVRSQLVLTLVDLRSGRVASQNIVPGSLPLSETSQGRVLLDLSAVLRELAVSLDIHSVRRGSSPDSARWNLADSHLVDLGYSSDEELSARGEAEFEGAAIAREARWDPQMIFYAGVEVKPEPDADEVLRELVELAGQLQLDLVVDVRVESNEALLWGVRLDLPGAEVSKMLTGRYGTLHRALLKTDAETSLQRLRSGSGFPPARWADCTRATQPSEERQADELTWAQIAARLTPLAVAGAGAVAVHRPGVWHFSTLKWISDPSNDLRNVLRPVPPVPEPPGALIPVGPCSKCDGRHSQGCSRCLGTGEELHGLVLTITDLRSRAKHVNWGSSDSFGASRNQLPASGFPLRHAELLLDSTYSVARQAEDFGVPPHLLRDYTRNAPLERALVDGRGRSFDEDLVGDYLRRAGNGRGGRLLVLARPEPVPPSEELFRAALGLGLSLAVMVMAAPRDRKSPAPAVLSWRVTVLAKGDAAPSAAFLSGPPTIEAAVAQLQSGFDRAVKQALRVEKLEPLPIPQQELEVRVDLPGIKSILVALSEFYPSTSICLRVDLNLWTCVLGAPHNRSASGATLVEMLVPLITPDLVPPRPDEIRGILAIILDRNVTEEQIEALDEDLQNRFRFGLAVGGLSTCLFRERFGPSPDPGALENLAVEVFNGSQEIDEEPIEQDVFTLLIGAMADPTRTAWRRILFEDYFSGMLDLVGCMLRDRLRADPDLSDLIEQAVAEGMLMVQALLGVSGVKDG